MAIKAKMLGREALMRKLNRLVPEAEKELAEAQMEVGREVASKIAARAPVESGEYKASIQADRLENRPNQTRIVGSNPTKDRNAVGVYAPFYWRFIEYGTKAHIIRAKNGKMLHLHGNRFAESVNHPGSPAQPHVMPTWRGYRKTARRKMANAVNKAVRKVKGK